MFLAYLQAHPTVRMGGQNLWLCLGNVMLPQLVNQVGGWLDCFATIPAQEAMTSLPLLKTKHGNACKAMDPVNRMLLLNQIKSEKVHRRRVGKSHTELQPAETT